ncbi:MAG: ATP-binding cassette domain-containing protein [Oscillospiraceae bacterium]|nr:ATP-binding cassette domain-containing protein [Oscillospiraceae bacterium]MBQ7054186.1 ATP-binding cassette domain-containing protein [Oscillospiraceae bacterium]
MIKITNLTKRYGPKEAVRGISFEVKKGEIVGFLGPNGAGKSTTMNVLTGYLSASGGSASIAGFDVLDDAIEARRHIGYLPEQPPLYFDMTVDEYLNFVYELKSAKQPRKSHLDHICELVGLSHVRRRLIRNLSKGYKQRVGIAQALVGDPDVLILDEPTVGLDPNQIVEIRNLIKNLGETRTVILSTHIIPEVAAVCERVIVINDGLIVADDKTENLMHNIGGENKFSAQVDGDPAKIVDVLRGVEGVTDVAYDNGSFILTADEGADIRKNVFYAAAEADLPLLSFAPVDVSLEAVFARLTKKGEEK